MHRSTPAEYSEDTAHTVEVIREENENKEFGSFGFTLLYEKPPIVGTIVPGEERGRGSRARPQLRGKREGWWVYLNARKPYLHYILDYTLLFEVGATAAGCGSLELFPTEGTFCG